MSRNASLVARTVSHLAQGAAESASVAWAEGLAQDFEKLLTPSESNEAALLSAIGMAKHERIGRLRDRILSNETASSGMATLRALEDRLKKDQYISPGSKEPTVADAVLAWSAREVVDYVLEPSDRVYEYPSSNRWLEACLSHEAFKRAYNEELTHIGVLDRDGPCRVVRGEVREGFMIDAKPVSTDARRAAEVVKALNAGYKKQQTQRQKEKATTETPAPAAAAQAGLIVAEFSLGDKIASSDPDKISKCVERVLKATGLASIERVDHPPAMDATNLSEALATKPGIKCKNLFLKAKKPKSETDTGLQLVCCPVDRTVDLKFLQTQLGYKDQLRFANEEALSKALDVVQGNVTPFALINDPDRAVSIVLDEEMLKNPEQLLWFHPLDNTASLGIPAGKLVEFVRASGRIATVLPLTPGASAAPVVAAADSATKQVPASSSKKSAAKGGEGAPTPTKKKAGPHPTVDVSADASSPKAKASLQSPPKTVEEALQLEEQALEMVQSRAAAQEAAREALASAKASGGDVDAAEKAFKAASRAKKEADMVYGNAAGFTEKLRNGGSSSSKAASSTGAESAASVQPLVFTLTHELAQDRLWARLDKLVSARPRKLDVTQEAGIARPKGHHTHNLLVKDNKSKRLYLVCLRQDREVPLKTIGEKLGAQGDLRLAGPADTEAAIALTRGCITPLSLFNNPQANVTPVFDAALMAEPDKKLVLCAGCDDHRNHEAHNCVDISVNEMLLLINEAGPREHLVLQLE